MITTGIIVTLGMIAGLACAIVVAVGNANEAFDNSDGACNCSVTKKCDSRHTAKCDNCRYNKGYSYQSYYAKRM